MGIFLFPQHPVLSMAILGILMFLGMIGMTLLGRRFGRRFLAGSDVEPVGLGAVDSAIFALFGLCIALTFSGATDRFQERKTLILEEAQVAGTAYSRLDLLPETARRELQVRFRAYVAARLEAYERLETLEKLEADLRHAEAVGAEIWRLAAAACREPASAQFAEVVLPPINEMLDAATARTTALRKHPPSIIYVFLFALGLFAAFLGGFAMARGKRLSWIHVLGFALASAVTFWVTLDLEHPRLGLFRIDSADQVLRHALEQMR